MVCLISSRKLNQHNRPQLIPLIHSPIPLPLPCSSRRRTGFGTFKDGDLLVNRDGVRIVSHSEVEAVRGLFFVDFFDVTFLGFL